MPDNDAHLLDCLSARYGGIVLRYPAGSFATDVAKCTSPPVHDPAFMPFQQPWTLGNPDEVQQRTVSYLRNVRRDATPDDWSIPLAVVENGYVRGPVSMESKGFLDTRSVSVGWWLAAGHQGRGLGTLAARILLFVVFECLGAKTVSSEVRRGNDASLILVRKLGYQLAGRHRHTFSDGEDEVFDYRLSRLEWESSSLRLEPEVYGVSELREFLGLN
jgi:RimJ/RimL family protein N-acetyltransferase